MITPGHESGYVLAVFFHALYGIAQHDGVPGLGGLIKVQRLRYTGKYLVEIVAGFDGDAVMLRGAPYKVRYGFGIAYVKMRIKILEFPVGHLKRVKVFYKPYTLGDTMQSALFIA